MASIAHASVEQTTNQTTISATYVDVNGATLTSGNFTTGKKYLLWVTAQIQNSTQNIITGCQVTHGSTAFSESQFLAANNIATFGRFTYAWYHIWTAVSGEAITLQLKSDGTNTANADQIHLLAINLSDDLVENTDWFFAEDATDALDLGTGGVDGASITFTPSGASDWLVASYALFNTDAINCASSLRRSGETTSSLPESWSEQNATGDDIMQLHPRVFALTAVSNTFKEHSRASAASGADRLHSKIFALNLNKFSEHANAYTEADTSLSATDYATELQTIAITPSIAGDVWIGAFWGFDLQDNSREAEFRVQVDGSDQPATQTSDNYQFEISDEPTDEVPMNLSTMPNLSAVTHTIDLDASTDNVTFSPAGQYRTLWAVTMELVSSAVTRTPNVGAKILTGTGPIMDYGIFSRSAIRGS